MEKGTLKPELVVSEDGSHTLKVAELKEHYHSHKGALRESQHVFLKHGFEVFSNRSELRILEVGFGTGLNALLTALAAQPQKVTYHTLETFPLNAELVSELNYAQLLDSDHAAQTFNAIHKAEWEIEVPVDECFKLQKIECPIQEYEAHESYDLVYYDAFAPHAQPELWEPEIWTRLFAMMSHQGVLVTYCAKGQVKRDMKAAGFEVEGLPGPPGKREMTRARKP